MTDCLAIRDLRVEREKNGARFTLRVPSLDLFRGQVLCVVGQSGCGKSTLLDVMALILRPTRAEAFLVRGERSVTDVLSASPDTLADLRAAAIGYVLQSGGLLSFLSVRDNILLPGRLLGYPEETLRERMLRVTRRIGVADQLDKKPQYLSGGQRQRVAIARALVHAPRLVFADEPTAAVDRETALEIVEVFREMAKADGAALVVVTHDVFLARQVADDMVGFALEKHGDTVISTLKPLMLEGAI